MAIGGWGCDERSRRISTSVTRFTESRFGANSDDFQTDGLNWQLAMLQRTEANVIQVVEAKRPPWVCDGCGKVPHPGAMDRRLVGRQSPQKLVNKSFPGLSADGCRIAVMEESEARIGQRGYF